MKPGVSWVATGFCPKASANFHAASKVSGDVFMPGDISINFISWAGRQKCIPTKRSGRPLPPAISVMEMVDVLEAKMVLSGQCLFNSEKSWCLTFKSSKMASITRSHWAISSSLVVPCHLCIAAAAPPAGNLPRSSDFLRNALVCSLALSSASCRVSNTMVRKPARAATMAMPAPMVPAPATPTV